MVVVTSFLICFAQLWFQSCAPRFSLKFRFIISCDTKHSVACKIITGKRGSYSSVTTITTTSTKISSIRKRMTIKRSSCSSIERPRRSSSNSNSCIREQIKENKQEVAAVA